MHRALLIPEIVLHIVAMAAEELDQPFSVLSGSVAPYITKKIASTYDDLRSLGLTARLFREPTLDIIWSTQYSLRPLLHVLDESFNLTKINQILGRSKLPAVSLFTFFHGCISAQRRYFV